MILRHDYENIYISGVTGPCVELRSTVHHCAHVQSGHLTGRGLVLATGRFRFGANPEYRYVCFDEDERDRVLRGR